MSNPRYVKKIGITAGSFDLLHSGHILMLKDCMKVCDKLIVCLQTDPTIDRPEKNKPIQTVQERLEQVDALKYVDQIMLYSTEAELYEILKTVRFDVRILGSDWRDKPFTGYDLPNMLEKCYFHNRNHDFSSSNLRERVYLAELEKRLKK